LVALSNVAQIPAALAGDLRGFVERGGGLLITLGNRFPAPSLEEQLQDLWPAKAMEKRLLTRDAERLVLLGEFERDHPIFRDLEEAGAQSLRTVEVYGYIRMKGEGRVLLRFANGDPALIEKQRGAGRVLLFASTFDSCPTYSKISDNCVRNFSTSSALSSNRANFAICNTSSLVNAIVLLIYTILTNDAIYDSIAIS